MKWFVVFLAMSLVSVISAEVSYAVQFEPYVKCGTLDSNEKDHQRATSHKAMVGVGFNTTFGAPGRFRKTFGAEYWGMAEPVDDDREVPHDGIVVSGKLSYQFFPSPDIMVYPFAGLGFERWRRNSPEGAQKRFYGDLCFADTAFGIGANYKRFYLEAGGLMPFWSDTDSGQTPNGRLGFTLNAGVLYKNRVNFGVFYTQKKFVGSGSQTDFELEQYGLMVGYRF